MNLGRVAHLARRLVSSLTRRPPAVADVAWALAQLLLGEAALWQQMPVQDRRHSIVVARRFLERRTTANRAEVAGALLHDVGKTTSNLGTVGRVVATIVGPRTSRFREYHNHEASGLRMLRQAGSDPATLALLDGTSSATAALRAADDI